MDTAIDHSRKYFNRLVLFIKESKWDSIYNGRGENIIEREGHNWKMWARIGRWWVPCLLAIRILSLRTKTWNDETPSYKSS